MKIPVHPPCVAPLPNHLAKAVDKIQIIKNTNYKVCSIHS